MNDYALSDAETTKLPDITITHYNRVLNTPALSLAVEGWNELFRLNLADTGSQLIEHTHSAIVVSVRDAPVGVMTWDDFPSLGAINVYLAYVVPEFRRKGIHRAMFNALVHRAQTMQREVITSGITVGNKRSLASHVSMGRKVQGFVTRFDVPRVNG